MSQAKAHANNGPHFLRFGAIRRLYHENSQQQQQHRNHGNQQIRNHQNFASVVHTVLSNRGSSLVLWFDLDFENTIQCGCATWICQPLYLRLFLQTPSCCFVAFSRKPHFRLRTKKETIRPSAIVIQSNFTTPLVQRQTVPSSLSLSIYLFILSI